MRRLRRVDIFTPANSWPKPDKMTRIASVERDGKQAGFVRISNLPREKMRTSEPPH
jgi:hypothetical protein